MKKKEAKYAPEEEPEEEAIRSERTRRRQRPEWSEERRTRKKPIRGEESDKLVSNNKVKLEKSNKKPKNFYKKRTKYNINKYHLYILYFKLWVIVVIIIKEL